MGSGDDGALDAVENGIVSLFSARVMVLVRPFHRRRYACRSI